MPTQKSFSALAIQQGIVVLDNQSRILISADYPYFRDDASNWPGRLSSLKSIGITLVTTYIPWRHHQTSPETAPDFSGLSQPNRDVLGFLALCAELGLMVIVKPGPFIHAEINYGGLPDWVCPCNNLMIEALLDSDGSPACWPGNQLSANGKSVERWPLPAPFSPEFLRLSRQWLEAVGEVVIRAHQAPQGPIVALQIGNEGIYSNGQHAPWAYDYSPSALAKYRTYLKAEYGSLENYNRLHDTRFGAWEEVNGPRKVGSARTAEPVRGLNDWGIFQAEYMNEIFNQWAHPLKSALPILLNQNPPLDATYGLDAWLTRVEPERWKGVQYGFTNWVGDVSAKPSAFDRYILTAKRFPGPNMEENWGFAELYDPAYIDSSTSFYQTLATLNAGATGFNIYTGVGTAHADKNLEVIQKAPYPDAAPINADGSLTPKAEIVRWLVKFFDRYGEEFLACRSAQPAAWGLYLPHARIAVWPPEADKGAPRHGELLKEFQKQMRHLHVDYGIVNLETSGAEMLQEFAFVFLAGGECMSKTVQQKLVEYALGGGRLVILGSIPRFDEDGMPCDVLWSERAALQSMSESGYAGLLAGLPRPEVAEGQADIWVRSHPERDLHFVTVLIPAQGKPRVDVLLTFGSRQQRLVVSATPSGGVILRIENGLITDALIKGQNAYRGHSVVPQCSLNSQIVGLDKSGDYARIGDWTASLYTQSPVTDKNPGQG